MQLNFKFKFSVVFYILFSFVLTGCKSDTEKMFQSIDSGNNKAFKKLVNHNLKLLNELNKDKQPPLEKAIISGNIDLVRFILDKNYNVNIPFYSGSTPLSLAVSSSYYNIAQLLIKKYKADVHYINTLGQSIIQEAYFENKEEFINLLLENGATKEEIFKKNSLIDIENLKFEMFSNLEKTLLNLIKQNNFKAVKEFIQKHPLINFQKKNSSENTLLHIAAASSSFDILKLILDEYPSVLNMQNREMLSPIMISAKKGLLKNFQYLLQKGALLNIVDLKNQSILHFAIYGGNTDIVEYLIKNTDLVNERDFLGRTPLGISILTEKPNLAKMLLTNGAYPNIRDKVHGNTPLFYAIQKSNTALMQLLFQFGADKSLPNTDNILPLEYARSLSVSDGVLDLLA